MKSGKSVLLRQIVMTFAKSGKKAGISFKISPHTLRALLLLF